MDEFKDYEELTKDELIKMLNELALKNLLKKATLKESLTTSLITDKDTIFFTSIGIILGKPIIDGSNYPTIYINLDDVVIIGEFKNTKTLSFQNPGFKLAVDQIIGFVEVDRKSFLSQI